MNRKQRRSQERMEAAENSLWLAQIEADPRTTFADLAAARRVISGEVLPADESHIIENLNALGYFRWTPRDPQDASTVYDIDIELPPLPSKSPA